MGDVGKCQEPTLSRDNAPILLQAGTSGASELGPVEALYPAITVLPNALLSVLTLTDLGAEFEVALGNRRLWPQCARSFTPRHAIRWEETRAFRVPTQ